MLAVAVWSVSIVITTVAFLYVWYVPLLLSPSLVWMIDLGTCSYLLPLWPLLAVYLFWVRCIDKSPENGGRTSQWFRSLSF